MNYRLQHALDEGQGHTKEHTVHRLIVWGAGRKAETLLDHLDSSRFTILHFVDSAPEKWGTTFKGYQVQSPESIVGADFDYVCVASYRHFFEIKNSLYELGVTSRILNVTELTRSEETVSPVLGIKDGRVWLRKICTYVAHACNLRCKYCNHFSQFAKGRVEAAEVASWINTWSTRVVPDHFYVAGGEPLLNKELDVVLRAARTAWPNTHLHLYTNGLLLPKISDNVVAAIHETGADVIVSKHYDDAEFNADFKKSVDALEHFALPNTVWNSFDTWTAFYRLSEDNKPLPWKTEPALAHRACVGVTGGRSVSLLDNKLYKCYLLAMVDHHLQQGGVLDGRWSLFDYTPVAATASAMEIIEKLSPTPEAACTQCPEFGEFTRPERLHQKRPSAQ